MSVRNLQRTFFFLLSMLAGALILAPLSNNPPIAMAAAVTPIQVDLTFDKPVYQPGDRVTLTITTSQFVEGQRIEIEVVKGVTETRIFYTYQEMTDNSITADFLLPYKGEFYQYLVKANVIGPDPSLSGTAVAMIFARENADKVTISNLAVDRKEVRPGEFVHIQFQIKDAVGNDIPWATPSIGLCKPDASKPDSVIVTPSISTTGSSDCTQYYANFYSAIGLFDINFGLLNNVPAGQYKLTIWADPLFSGHNGFIPAKEAVDLEVKGEPVNPNEKAATANLVISESQSVPPQFRDGSYGDGYLTYGQDAIFSAEYNENDPVFQNTGFLPAQNVLIHWFVIDPDGKVIWEDRQSLDGQGVDSKQLAITKELKRGRYEVYINATQNGYYIPYSGVTSFFVVNLQRYDVAVEEGSYEVYFQGVDLDSSNIVFDQDGKNISLDIHKLEGNFDNRHPYRGDDIGWAYVSIESPLLSEPFTAQINGKPINAIVWNRIDNQTMLKVGPIDENGLLTINAAHSIPEFPLAHLTIASSLVMAIVVFSVYKKKYSTNI